MTPRHLDNLFSTAYEGEMTPVEEARFDTHMKSCAPCAAAYAEFKATVDELRGLPKARMPLAVHLPSSLPVAAISTRPRARWGWFNLGIFRRFPATAVAGAFVIVIAIGALVHGNGNPSTSSSTAASGVVPNVANDHGVAGSGTTASCPIVNITGASPPASFSQEDLATDPAQPALHLTLAAPTLKITAGKPAVVYAQLSVPVSGLSNPGTVTSQLPSRAAFPCVAVSVGSSTSFEIVAPVAQPPEAQGSGSIGGPAPLPTTATTGPLFAINVPAGLPPGTEVHVVATVPAKYAGLNSPALTAELTLTTT